VEKNPASVTEPEPSDSNANDNLPPLGIGADRADLVLALTLVNQARAMEVLGSNLALGAQQLGMPISAPVALSNLGGRIADQLYSLAVSRWGAEAMGELVDDLGARPATSGLVVVP